MSTDHSEGKHPLPSMAIIEAIAAREGVEPAELEQSLFEVIDPEALDSLFKQGKGSVTFTYAGYEAVVYSDDRVEIKALN